MRALLQGISCQGLGAERLLEKLDFNYVAEVSIGEILVKEDEF